MGLWLALLFASFALVVASASIVEYAVFAAACAFIGAAILWYRLKGFNRVTRTLLETGRALEPYDYSAQARRSVYLIIGVLAFLALPLALSGYLDPASWFGSVVGGIDGWLASLVAYNLLLARWQRRNGGRLYQSLVWRGTKVTHRGLSFQRGPTA